MILSIQVDPEVAQIYQAEAERIGTTMLELMSAVVAFWPAAQWDMKRGEDHGDDPVDDATQPVS